jgi:hypothetical protein
VSNTSGSVLAVGGFNMKTADNVYQSITVWDDDRGSLEFRGNGIILIEDFNGGHEICIQIDRVQMKALAAFLVKAAKGLMDGIGNPEGGDS